MIEMNRILCPVDFSPFSERALRYAMGLANWYGARVKVLHVMPPPPQPPSAGSNLAATTRRLTARNLQDLVDRCHLPNVDTTFEIVEAVEPTATILDGAEAFDADLIVTGSHGRSGVQRVLLGSVVEALLHRSGRPILAVPSHVDPTRLSGGVAFDRIICAVDFATASIQALAHAFSIAEEAKAKVTLLHVIEVPPEIVHPPRSSDYDVDRVRAEAEAESLTRLRALVPEHARDYCTVHTEVLEGGAARQILRLAESQRADLIVLGVHGRNAFDLAFFGSNSKDVIRQSRCPVLVVPAGRRGLLRVASSAADLWQAGRPAPAPPT